MGLKQSRLSDGGKEEVSLGCPRWGRGKKGKKGMR